MPLHYQEFLTIVGMFDYELNFIYVLSLYNYALCIFFYSPLTLVSFLDQETPFVCPCVTRNF